MQLFGMPGMYVAGFILLLAYVFIATEKIPKVTIAMLGAAITLLLGLVKPEAAFHHVDFAVIFLLVSMMITVNIASRSGMFNWLAIEMIKFTKGKPKYVLAALALFTAVASAFLDNVTTVILIMPVTFVIARELKIDPIPFLITEILASNIGGTATLIGDPPNIIIGIAANLGFMDFVTTLTPVVTVTFVICIALLIHMFKKDLQATPEQMALVAKLDNSKSIKDKGLMIRSGIVLALVVLGFVLHDLIHIHVYIIAMLGASILLLFESPSQIIHDLEWGTVFFFVGLFIIIGGLVETGGITMLAQQLLNVTLGDLNLTSMLVLWASGILSGIVDNIPYTATMVPLIQELKTSMDIVPLWWALSLGACFGGNATIIGAAANVIVSETSAAAGHKISFMRFLKYGAIVTFISLVCSSVYIYLLFLK